MDVHNPGDAKSQTPQIDSFNVINEMEHYNTSRKLANLNGRAHFPEHSDRLVVCDKSFGT